MIIKLSLVWGKGQSSLDHKRFKKRVKSIINSGVTSFVKAHTGLYEKCKKNNKKSSQLITQQVLCKLGRNARKNKKVNPRDFFSRMLLLNQWMITMITHSDSLEQSIKHPSLKHAFHSHSTDDRKTISNQFVVAADKQSDLFENKPADQYSKVHDVIVFLFIKVIRSSFRWNERALSPIKCLVWPVDDDVWSCWVIKAHSVYFGRQPSMASFCPESHMHPYLWGLYF